MQKNSNDAFVQMAIPFISLSFINNRAGRGACAITAYIGRTVVQDLRGKRHDFRRARGDLVHEEVVMPAGVEGPALNPTQFARMIDDAEAPRSKRAKSAGRQVFLAVVAALPPDSECTLDEALEICRALVDRIVADRALVAHIAIHDPAVKFGRGQSRNRHAHIHFSLREWTATRGFSRRKLREQVARVRHYKGAKGTFNAVAEGISWPDVSRELQNRFFFISGRHVVVDPINVIPHRHFGKLSWHYEEKTVRQELDKIAAANRHALAGQPADIVTQMLRGRSSLSRAELRIFIKRYIDAENERRDLFDAIATNASIVNLAPPDGRLVRLTTRGLYDRFARVHRFLLDVVEVPESRSAEFRVVVGSTSRAINADIVDLCRHFTPIGAHAGTKKLDIVVIGAVLSHCDDLGKSFAMRGTSVDISTVHDALMAASDWSARTLVIISRAEAIRDGDLADLLIATEAVGAHLVLGYDVVRADGMTERRLATWIVDRMSPEAAVAALCQTSDNLSLDHKLLNAGLVRTAWHHMFSLSPDGLQNGPTLIFSDLHEKSERRPELREIPGPGFIVVDDPGMIQGITETERAAALQSNELVSLRTASGRKEFAIGEWVVFEKSDYASQPVLRREGHLAKIRSIYPERSALVVEHAGGQTDLIEVGEFSFIRPAYALTISEARQLPPGFHLYFEVTRPEGLYPTFLLATRYRGRCTITIDQTIALNPEGLLGLLESNLPGVLPWQCQLRRDRNAEQNNDVNEVFSRQISRLGLDLPGDPEGPKVRIPKALQTAWRSSEIRSAVELTQIHRNGFANLLAALDPNAPNRLAHAARIRSVCTGDLAQRIITKMMASHRKKPGQKSKFDEMEVSAIFDELLTEFEPSFKEIADFKADLQFLTLHLAGLSVAPKQVRNVRPHQGDDDRSPQEPSKK